MKDLNIIRHLKPTIWLFIPQISMQIYTVPKKAKTVHCNFVMDETYHQNLKLIAIRKGNSLKSVLQEAISDYLDKNSSLL